MSPTQLPGSVAAFDKIWLMDFEFRQPNGGLPEPRCVVAKEWRTGQVVRRWLADSVQPTFEFGPHDLLVAYYASAEVGCCLSLGWPLPHHVLDLYPEFKLHVAGRQLPSGFGILGALAYFGFAIATPEGDKKQMRELAQQTKFSSDEVQALLRYCESDVVALEKLFDAMVGTLDWPRAILRGRYMSAAAKIERTGVPLDTERLNVVVAQWPEIHEGLICAVDAEYNTFEGGRFKEARRLEYCSRKGILWPLLESGRAKLDDDTFRDMARTYPCVLPMKELRANLSKLRLRDLTVGPDGRNRHLLSAFGSTTGRNQPSTAKSIFGPAAWFRFLIKPPPGEALAYIDYEQQEFGIGAALSEDPNMLVAYETGDPYLSFAKQASAVPPDATKLSHKYERDLYKTCALAVQYGMSAESLGRSINLTTAHGRQLLGKHREVYRAYWSWSDRIEARAMLGHPLETAFGWRVKARSGANPRSLRNFPLQANGAEMLRLACIALTEAGIKVCAPVHDALLVEAPEVQIDEVVGVAQNMMAQASLAVLGDLSLRTEVKTIRHPDRYRDPRGEAMWQHISELVAPNTTPFPASRLPFLTAAPECSRCTVFVHRRLKN